MAPKSNKKKPYAERSDLEKIRSQWSKLTGLHTRDEWSAAVVRAATAAELAANLAIKSEYANRSSFSAEYVNNLLRFASGLDNKMRRLLLPSVTPTKKKKFEGLQALAESISSNRNAIVHQGEFRHDNVSREVIENARRFIEQLVRVYYPRFKLEDKGRL